MNHNENSSLLLCFMGEYFVIYIHFLVKMYLRGYKNILTNVPYIKCLHLRYSVRYAVSFLGLFKL